MKKASLLLSAGLLLSSLLPAQLSVNAIVDGHNPAAVISRHIYGHFSEHLGRCIYDGFWVSDTLQVPKKDRIRLDIVEALKKINIPLANNYTSHALIYTYQPLIRRFTLRSR